MTHWLEEKLDRLAGLAQNLAPSENRERFGAALASLVQEIAGHDGVTAAFACHEGLAFEVAGRTPDFEALSAMAQLALAAAKETALTLALGRLQQMVIVGTDHKLALFRVGQLGLGILSPVHVNLGRTLEQSPPPQNQEATAMPATILDEIGGRSAVEMVVADFYGRVLADPELKLFFRGVQMGRLQQLQTDFFCAVLGNKPWQGRDLASVHAGMHITENQFNRVAMHLQSSLRDAGVPAVRVDQIVSLVATLKGQIVGDGPPSIPDKGARAGQRNERLRS